VDDKVSPMWTLVAMIDVKPAFMRKPWYTWQLWACRFE
jgi:hypothetical protein